MDRRSAHQSDSSESQRCWEDQSSHESPTERHHSNDPKEVDGLGSMVARRCRMGANMEHGGWWQPTVM
ncbi:hypothetical protein F2Q70_00043908 [Brassica cretica]|uniref:Uncharacterized protein n=1 Tax=Brassica cretica TaxID=69181 RepID=A0A8S9KFY7_BRACR|nr:hypothetical protein F2Q70_00043907 [Brassica cretica]KAF2592353.1 hypothetical protein F2Q70_00043908 [Brassica cretica]